MNNPLTMLDSLLSDWASPRVRRLIHALIAAALLVVSAILAADGDWKAALLSLAVTAYAAMNKANTPPATLDAAGEDSEPGDLLTYEEAGGLPFPEAKGWPTEGDVDR